MSIGAASLGRVLALSALAAGCWRSARPPSETGMDATVPRDGADALDAPRPPPPTDADIDAAATDVGPCSDTTADDRCRIALATGETYPYNLAVNATHLYWTTAYTVSVSHGTVMRIALAGGQPEELATGPNPHTIVLDDTSVYWTDFTPTTGAIMKMPLDGGTPVAIARNQANPHGLSVDQSSVYWTNFDGMQIRKASKQPPSGGTSTVVELASNRPLPNNLAVDDTFVYWTEWITSGAVMKTRIDGTSAVMIVAPLQDHPYGVTLDRTNLYWTNSTGGQVMKMPLDGSAAPVTLAAGQVQPFGLAVDDTSVYWANYAISVPNFVGQVRRVPIAGGDVTELWATSTSFDVAVDGHSVYWTTYETAARDGDVVAGGSVFRMTPK